MSRMAAGRPPSYLTGRNATMSLRQIPERDRASSGSAPGPLAARAIPPASR